MKSCRYGMFVSLAMASAVAFAAKGDAPAIPQITAVSMTQASDRLVTITYTLKNAPAVVTLDIETNGVSIGGANIDRLVGDVNVLVSEDGEHTITWRPDLSWPGHKISDNSCRAAVTAWAPDNTPDYMVVDISAAAKPGDVRYYPAVEFLPGGDGSVTNNHEYRTTSIVMRKIKARDVLWTMGSYGEGGDATTEATHKVRLDHDYYIGIFPVTQTQWELIAGYNNSSFTLEGYKRMRPVNYLCYSEIRTGDGSGYRTNQNLAINTGSDYPNSPNGGSFLGKLRNKTGIDFDLPSEAQWEYACRAGCGCGFWGDGTSLADPMPGRNQNNGGSSATPAAEATDASGTAVVGSYPPNKWGLYDMHGNVWEWCLDYWADDITNLNGAVNTTSHNYKCIRGGGFASGPSDCRSGRRGGNWAAAHNQYYGCRLACRAGLQ